MEPEVPQAWTVLVVDDNEQNRALAQMTLVDEGYRVELAVNGPEALALFARETPDCVLLDVRMPGMDGHAVCQKIRAMAGGADVPVIFLTAMRDVDTFDRALAAGGTDFLTKPVQPAELVLRVQQALKLRRLDAELRAQYDLLRQQRDELYRLQLVKEDLAAFIVHDLKNPVNAIDLQAQVILRDRELSARSRAAAGHVRTEVRDLLRLILNLLDITRSEQGQMRPTLAPIDPRTLVTEVLESRAGQAEVQGVTLRAAVHVDTLDADADLLRRVLENLVENAVRHSPDGSEVRVEVSATERGVEIAVADQGLGVPEAMRATIFERFVQLNDDATARGRGGRGLGLAFCKLAVEAHGGRIEVGDARPGAVFRLRLPSRNAP